MGLKTKADINSFVRDLMFDINEKIMLKQKHYTQWYINVKRMFNLFFKCHLFEVIG